MPGEEMEITTDFGHTGFENDSDIDLDFAVGQADEDLELADFDHAQEMQNFNSDTRDELMAEGDDASYGMIDADDIEHTEITTTANDIEIDLGDTDELLWHHGVSHDAETFENAAEIDYADNVDIGNTNTENAGSGEGSWLGTSYATGNPDETEAELQVTTVDTTAGNLLQDGTVHIDGIAAQDFGLPENKGNNIEIVPTDDNNGLEVVAQTEFDGQQNTAPIDATQPAEDVTAGEQDDEGVDNGVEADVLTGQPGIAYETHEDTQQLASHHDVSETGYDHGDDAIDYEEDPSASVTSDHRSAEEHFIEEQDQDQNDLTNLQAFEHQLGGDSYTEPTNDHESVDQALGEEGDPTPATGKAGSRSPAEKSHSENQGGIDDDGENGENQAPTSPAHVEHPLSIATRHEMFITYGQTDYRLFAKSDHDDPNQYFLSDMSALELPLGEFLSSLREVIADEVSPLDELVMHVDGLGLEFSQSSASDMLEEFTFGDILSLYDRLVKNDGEESPTPDLCTHLMVRPNCRQRLMALLDSASLGRGLSEMAVYRERTPAPGEQADDSESEDSYDPPQLEGGEEDYGYDENEHADGEADEHGAEDAENDVGSYSPSVHTPAVTGAKTDEPANEAEKSGDYIEENASTNNDAATVDGPIDYSDDEDELDLSLKQDQQPNASLENNLHKDQEQSGIVAADEHGYSNQHTPLANESADAHNSDITSASATLNGDDKDEIDYSDDDDDFATGNNDPSFDDSGAPTTSNAPIDDEITWESENEDAKNELTKAPKETVQVSPSSGKRPRSESDLPEGEAERHDVKRRRPS